MVDVLRNVAADPKERRKIEQEWLAMKDEEGYEQVLKALAEERKALAEERKARAKDKKTIAKKDKALAEAQAVIEEMKQRFGISQ